MKKYFAILLLLSSCGGKKEVIREVYVPSKAPEVKEIEHPTCSLDYVQSYVNLTQKMKVLEYKFKKYSADYVKKEIEITRRAYQEFSAYSTIISCTLLENGKLKEIRTEEVIDQSFKKLVEIQGELK